jgi:excisionase family DNA binding protein
MGRKKKNINVNFDGEIVNNDQFAEDLADKIDKNVKNDDNIDEIDKKSDHGLPKKELFRVEEVAEYFGVTERTIRLWIEHGHLDKEKIVGIVRVPRRSILRCRFMKN